MFLEWVDALSDLGTTFICIALTLFQFKTVIYLSSIYVIYLGLPRVNQNIKILTFIGSHATYRTKSNLVLYQGVERGKLV